MSILAPSAMNMRFFSSPGAAAPVNTLAPVASGDLAIGSTLSVTTGTWTGDPVIVYTYQWQRNGVDIGGETLNTHVVVQADANTTLRCVVTATNGVGAASANSNGLAVVVYVYDLFTDPNGTLITAHVPVIDTVGGGWAFATVSGAAPSGTNPIITNNRLDISGASQACVINTGDNDVDVRCQLITDGAGNANRVVMVRFLSNGNYYEIYFNSAGSLIEVRSRIAGAVASLANGAFVFGASTTYTVRVVVSGSTVTVYMNGVQIVTYATLALYPAETKHGLGRTTTVGIYFDTLQIIPA